MSIPVKIQFQEETRRLSVEPSTSFEELCAIVSKIEPLFNASHVFQYQDNEGDSVFVTSTLELSEALASAKSKGLTLKLVVVEKPKPSVQKFENPEPQVMKTTEAPKDAQESVANIENAIQGLVDKVALLAKGAQKGAETVLPKVTQVIEPAFTTAKTFGTEHYTALREWKDPVGDFLRVVSQKVEEAAYGSTVVHQAWCDNCKSQIKGIRYKCGNCADYDLCQYCEIKQIHNPEHVFLKINTPITFAQTKVLLPDLYEKVVSKEQAPSPAPVSPVSVPFKKATTIAEEDIVPLDAVFVTDETVKDGTVFSPDTAFVKIWVMQNSGSQKWVEGTKLVLVSGNPFGSKGEIPVRAAEVGEKIDIFAEMKAPSTPGRFASHWRLSTPDGHKFGHRIWVEIIVDEKAPKQEVPQVVVPKPVEVPAPAPAPAPAPVSDLEKQYASTLAALNELGFSNKEKNLALAQKFNGDIVQIVTCYLDN